MTTGPTLQTERLLLRQWKPGDVEPYGRMLADPPTARFIVPGAQPVPPEYAWDHAAVMAGHWAIHGMGMFVLEDRSTGEFLGRVGAWSPAGWFGLEVGWGIVPAARGKGIAFEAAIAAMRWTFEHSGADEIIHCIDDENEPSKRVARRVGAEPREPITLFGHPAVKWVSSRGGFAALHG
jgi:RimJ/RimL family protein N-acetyltransferase